MSASRLFAISLSLCYMYASSIKLLDKAAKDKKIGYHPYCKDLEITHLCFADDILIFSDGKRDSVHGILKVFDEFASYSGLKISLEKSTIFIAGVGVEEMADILTHFPLESGTLPVRYLGLPPLTKRMTVNDYNPLVERVRTRLTSWTARHLSIAGRLQLVASVIHSLVNFWMSVFRLPKQCIKEIDQLCSAFVWFGPELNSNKAKVAWSHVCKPKKEGGLGLRSLEEMNKVSTLKLVWKIISSDSLWVRWIRRYLIRKGSFWNSKKNSLGSWLWNKILKYRTMAHTLTKVEVGSGASVSFWFDNWSLLGRLIDLTGTRGCIDLGIQIGDTVEMAVQKYRSRRHRVDILIQIEGEIMKLRAQSLSTVGDICLWKGSNDEFTPVFSTKHTWNSTREVSPKVPWFQGVGFSAATPKYSVLVWIAVRDRLATGDMMKRWNAQVDDSCVLCNA